MYKTSYEEVGRKRIYHESGSNFIAPYIRHHTPSWYPIVRVQSQRKLLPGRDTADFTKMPFHVHVLRRIGLSPNCATAGPAPDAAQERDVSLAKKLILPFVKGERNDIAYMTAG